MVNFFQLSAKFLTVAKVEAKAEAVYLSLGISEIKIASCIKITDVLYHFANPRHVAGEFAIFYVVAQQITEDSAEIFVARIGQETPRIGEHSHKAREQTHIGQRIELFFHAIFLV